jgi:hypothetical protein
MGVAACLAGAPALFGWGPEGHHIVARLALERMTPEAKSAVQDLLGSEDFVGVSTWGDEIRRQRPETYNWHFVDIPYSEFHYDAARDCKSTPQGDCIVAELERARKELTDASLSKDQRKESLKWIIHLMGDLHQPLHCIDNHDRGGNDVFVSVVGQPPPQPPAPRLNLHAVWDSTVLAERNPDETATLALLDDEYKGQRIQGAPIDFVQWAEATHQTAVEYVYTYPDFSPGTPPAATRTVELSKDYQDKAKLAIDHQLELGGVRLASLLNAAFRPR